MKTFLQWLENIDEDGLRTSLGPYPPSYGVGQYPPSYFTPISAAAIYSLRTFHGLKDKDIHSDNKQKKKSKHKKKSKKGKK